MKMHLPEEQIVPYLDGRLEAAARAQFDQHLAGCAACRGRIAEMRALLGVLDGWQAAGASPGFDAALRLRLEAEKERRRPWFMPRPAYAAALVFAVVLAIGLAWWRPGSPPPAPAPSVARTISPAQQATPQGAPAQGTNLAQQTTAEESDALAALENPVLLDNYELLEGFDVLFEPLSQEEKKL